MSECNLLVTQAKVTLSDGQVLYACNIVDYPAEVLTTANKMRFLGNMMYKVCRGMQSGPVIPSGSPCLVHPTSHWP